MRLAIYIFFQKAAFFNKTRKEDNFEKNYTDAQIALVMVWIQLQALWCLESEKQFLLLLGMVMLFILLEHRELVWRWLTMVQLDSSRMFWPMSFIPRIILSEVSRCIQNSSTDFIAASSFAKVFNV